jgi:hypothetical protein
MGYAAGFANMMRWLMRRIPKEERYVNGVRAQPRRPWAERVGRVRVGELAHVEV